MFNSQSGTYYPGSQFPDPLNDFSGQYMPRDLTTMLRWCEALWANNGTYRMALERVCSYFLTKVELTEVADTIKDKYEDFLNDSVNIMSNLRAIGLDFLFYGNSFSSVYVPFKRFIACPKCGTERPTSNTLYTFKGFKFYSTCSKCGFKGEHKHTDRRSMQSDRLRVIRWSPHVVSILFSPISHCASYVYDVPADFKEHIKQGRTFYVESTPWEIIEAIRDNLKFRFDDNSIYHLKEETLAGLNNRGWGIPRAISVFKLGFYIQVLKRYNEALAMDYIVPWRVVSPSRGGGSQLDPILNSNLGEFTSKVASMVSEHRKDPFTVHAMPYPLEYQVLGGEGQELTPHELLTVSLDELLNSVGIPAELYKGTLQLQAMPTALRLFEATWPHLVHGFNGWLNWFLERVALAFNWERARAKLMPVTRADDIEARTIRLQLAAAQKISDSTALSPLGIDVRDEARRISDEQRMWAEEQQRIQKEQEQTAEMQRRFSDMAATRSGAPPGALGQPGVPGAMGMPGTGAGGAITPSDILSQADALAQQLLAMPESERRRQLGDIASADPTLHAVTKERMTKMRTEARSIGQDQVLSQMTGNG